MALQKDRRRIFVKGLGNFSVREVDPTPASSFSEAGFRKSPAIDDVYEMENIIDEQGNLVNVLPKTRSVTYSTNLQQSTKDEFDLVQNAGGKIYAARYYGLTEDNKFQYFCFDQARLHPNLTLAYQPGER